MKEAKNSTSKASRLFLRVSDLFLPTLDELKYFIAFVLACAVLFLDSTLFSAFISEVKSDPRVLAYPLIAGYVAYVTFSEKELGEDNKLIASAFYYGLFAVLAFDALKGTSSTPSAVLSLASINYWLIKTILILAILRGIYVLIVLRLDDSILNKSVTQNFKGTQYRKFAFLYAAVIAYSFVVLLDHFYDRASIILTLGYTYTSIVITITHNLFYTKFRH